MSAEAISAPRAFPRGFLLAPEENEMLNSLASYSKHFLPGFNLYVEDLAELDVAQRGGTMGRSDRQSLATKRRINSADGKVGCQILA